MKLYDAVRAPSPRRVRIYLAEKGIDVPKVVVDLAAFEEKSESFRALNPLQRIPVLELDDGTTIAETIAICRYFEALYPEPNLFGRDALEIAQVEMWSRRIELGVYTSVQAVFRHGHPGMAKYEVPQVQQWAEVNKPRVEEFLEIMDDELAKHEFIAGGRYTVADITGLVAMDFMRAAKLSLAERYRNVRRWYAELAARPSAKA
jgi:glutathione S-transferase